MSPGKERSARCPKQYRSRGTTNSALRFSPLKKRSKGADAPTEQSSTTSQHPRARYFDMANRVKTRTRLLTELPRRCVVTSTLHPVTYSLG